MIKDYKRRDEKTQKRKRTQRQSRKERMMEDGESKGSKRAARDKERLLS